MGCLWKIWKKTSMGLLVRCQGFLTEGVCDLVVKRNKNVVFFVVIAEKNEQLLELKLLCGYISLFGRYKLSSLLLSPTHLQHLLKTLLHICQFDTYNVHLLEEIANPGNLKVNGLVLLSLLL